MYFYSSNILNSGILLAMEEFLDCGISTFTYVKDLSTSSTTGHLTFTADKLCERSL